MKYLIPFLIIFCFTSCFSTRYIAEKHKGNFDKVRAGNKYTVLDKNDKKVTLTLTSVEKDSIRGTKKTLPYSIAKNDIKRIRKNNTAGTVLIAGGAAAGVTIITVTLLNLIRGNSDDSPLDDYKYQLD